MIHGICMAGIMETRIFIHNRLVAIQRFEESNIAIEKSARQLPAP